MLKQLKQTIESLKKYQDQLLPKAELKKLKGGIGSEDLLDG